MSSIPIEIKFIPRTVTKVNKVLYRGKRPKYIICLLLYTLDVNNKLLNAVAEVLLKDLYFKITLKIPDI